MDVLVITRIRVFSITIARGVESGRLVGCGVVGAPAFCAPADGEVLWEWAGEFKGGAGSGSWASEPVRLLIAKVIAMSAREVPAFMSRSVTAIDLPDSLQR